MEEKIDKYRCLKIPIFNILKRDGEIKKKRNKKHKKIQQEDKYLDLDNKQIKTLDIIHNAVNRSNQISIKAYMLLKLWVLSKYHSGLEIPIIDEKTIKAAIKSLTPSSVGRQTINTGLLNEFQILKDTVGFKLESGLNLSSILDYCSTNILTSIENNIKANFITYIKRFINGIFLNIPENIQNLKDPESKKQLYKELNELKNDIINNTTLCDSKYHEWLLENRFKIVPKEYDTNYYYDLTVSPQKYLKYMIFMNLELEKIIVTSEVKGKEIKHEVKMFQFFPLQTNIIPNHITIDTKSLIELFVPKGKRCKKGEKSKIEYLSNLTINQEKLWKDYFQISDEKNKDSKYYKQKMNNYKFDHTIITDGYSVSIRFIHESFVEEETSKKLNMSIARKSMVGLTDEEKTKIRKDKEEVKEQKKLEAKEIRDEKNLKEKEELKKLTKEEKEIKKQEELALKISKNEFQYIEDVPITNLVGKNIKPIFIDPGKRALLSMFCGKHFLQYTNSCRLAETKRLKYQRFLSNYKLKLDITRVENELSGYNSKTCNIEKFIKYMIKKIEVNEKLYSQYRDITFRKYKWYSYLNRKRSEDKMLNAIEKKFGEKGKDLIMIIGDWSISKQMSHFISTPNLALKRKLKTRFKVYNIDEFRTSCLNNKTEEYCSNLYLPDKKGEIRKIHSILTFKMENQRKGCINRDKNGCKNIKKIFDSYIENGTRPLRYQRSYKIENVVTSKVGCQIQLGSGGVHL